jgi:hypothetical protein
VTRLEAAFPKVLEAVEHVEAGEDVEAVEHVEAGASLDLDDDRLEVVGRQNQPVGGLDLLRAEILDI